MAMCSVCVVESNPVTKPQQGAMHAPIWNFLMPPRRGFEQRRCSRARNSVKCSQVTAQILDHWTRANIRIVTSWAVRSSRMYWILIEILIRNQLWVDHNTRILPYRSKQVLNNWLQSVYFHFAVGLFCLRTALKWSDRFTLLTISPNATRNRINPYICPTSIYSMGWRWR